MAGGLRPQAYVHNPMEWVDPLGLVALDQGGFSVYGLYDKGATEPYYIGISNDPLRRKFEHMDTGRLGNTGDLKVLPNQSDLSYAEARGYEQANIEKYGTKTGVIGQDISETNRGNKINSFDKTRTDERGEAFNKEYEKAKSNINKPSQTGKCKLHGT